MEPAQYVSHATLIDLNFDCLAKVFSFIPTYKEIAGLRYVNRQFREAANMSMDSGAQAILRAIAKRTAEIDKLLPKKETLRCLHHLMPLFLQLQLLSTHISNIVDLVSPYNKGSNLLSFFAHELLDGANHFLELSKNLPLNHVESDILSKRFAPLDVVYAKADNYFNGILRPRLITLVEDNNYLNYISERWEVIRKKFDKVEAEVSISISVF
jgi:hypothetical protein